MHASAQLAIFARSRPRSSGLKIAAPSPATFLPKEHGSWSLVLEPLILGLLVAPSFAGVALATAAFAGFLARRPLNTAFSPSPSGSRTAARRTMAILFTLAITGLFEAVLLGGLASLWPLLIAAPLGGLFIYFDAQGDGRATAAEVAGSSAFALLPSALSTLAGWSAPAALALAAIALTRSVPTVLTVRAYLRRRKGQPIRPVITLLAATAACFVVALLGRFHLVPAPVALGAGLLLLRSAWFLSPWRPLWSARAIGTSEALLGVIYVAIAAVAYHAT
jgi:hypothetical protein